MNHPISPVHPNHEFSDFDFDLESVVSTNPPTARKPSISSGSASSGATASSKGATPSRSVAVPSSQNEQVNPKRSLENMASNSSSNNSNKDNGFLKIILPWKWEVWPQLNWYQRFLFCRGQWGVLALILIAIGSFAGREVENPDTVTEFLSLNHAAARVGQVGNLGVKATANGLSSLNASVGDGTFFAVGEQTEEEKKKAAEVAAKYRSK